MNEYIPSQCLREEVQRFKRTNTFTPMEVTGFYIQAAVVLDEHAAMVEELADLRTLLKSAGCALRSYQYGNESPDLAAAFATKIEEHLAAPLTNSNETEKGA